MAEPAGVAQRNRRNAGKTTGKEMTTLPSEGFSGEIPEWPLEPDVYLAAQVAKAKAKMIFAQRQVERHQDDDWRRAEWEEKVLELSPNYEQAKIIWETAQETELRLWRLLWRTPQAVIWDKAGWIFEVAGYARLQAKSLIGDSKSATEARQWSNLLGINPLAMMKLRLEIENLDKAQDERSDRDSRRPVAYQAPAIMNDPRNVLTEN